MISLAWLTKQEELLSITSKGPDRDRFAAEIAEKRAQYAAEQESLAPFLAAGFKPNQFAGRCAVTKVDVEAYQGFTKKSPTTGKWYVLTREEAAKRLGKKPA